ncbi:MAG: ArgE/DapE family deacylase [Chloroflexi bacterium]|nr:ArgE/DapE family deacylase [Chloroflexota bacterium]
MIDAANLDGLVDPRRIEADLRRLIRARSVTGDETAVQAEMLRLLAAAGVPIERLDPDPLEIARDPDWPGEEVARTSLPIVVGRLGRPGKRRILLVGHVDVVPPGDPATWTVDPWSGEVRDGDLYGRGACDMKGGVVAIVEALRVILAVADPATFDGELVAAFVPSEEDGGQGMLAAIRAGVVGDAAVITEPTSLDVVVAHAGAITFRLTVPGRAAHASMRREGVSALEKLQVLMEALADDEALRNAAETEPLMTAIGLPYPTIIGKVAGGEWASTVPDRVVADGRYGVRLGQTAREAEADLRACIARATEADDFLRNHPVGLEIVGGRFSSAQVPADHPLPVALADAAEAVLGRRPIFGARPYGADMRLLVKEGRTPTVIFGPGDARVAHSADEHVPLQEVADCARVLALWALRELRTAFG